MVSSDCVPGPGVIALPERSLTVSIVTVILRGIEAGESAHDLRRRDLCHQAGP